MRQDVLLTVPPMEHLDFPLNLDLPSHLILFFLQFESV